MDAEQFAELTGTNRPCGLVISLRQTFEIRARDSDCENPASLRIVLGSALDVRSTRFPVVILEEATPDPIPNSEVKLLGADGTAREAVWESRTLPGFFCSRVKEPASRGLFFLSSASGVRRDADAAPSRVTLADCDASPLEPTRGPARRAARPPGGAGRLQLRTGGSRSGAEPCREAARRPRDPRGSARLVRGPPAGGRRPTGGDALRRGENRRGPGRPRAASSGVERVDFHGVAVDARGDVGATARRVRRVACPRTWRRRACTRTGAIGPHHRGRRDVAPLGGRRVTRTRRQKSRASLQYGTATVCAGAPRRGGRGLVSGRRPLRGAKARLIRRVCWFARERRRLR